MIEIRVLSPYRLYGYGINKKGPHKILFQVGISRRDLPVNLWVGSHVASRLSGTAAPWVSCASTLAGLAALSQSPAPAALRDAVIVYHLLHRSGSRSSAGPLHELLGERQVLAKHACVDGHVRQFLVAQQGPALPQRFAHCHHLDRGVHRLLSAHKERPARLEPAPSVPGRGPALTVHDPSRVQQLPVDHLPECRREEDGARAA